MLPLDNPIWTALTTKQVQLAHGSALARRFPPEMTLLGALAANTAMALESLAQLITAGETELDLYEVTELTSADIPEMSEIYAATRPGRFLCPKIQKLGTFVGVRHDGKLVAMGGLRLHISGYREITTVATLPEFEGRGYGTAVVRALIARIESKGERPFLTVRTDNERAIGIYRKLGFSQRTRFYSQTIRRS